MEATNTPSFAVTAPTICSREAQDAPGLAALVEKSVQMVTWDRPTEPDVVRFAREVLAEQPFELRESIEKDAIDSFDPVPEFARTAAPESAERFAEDVRFILRLFAELTDARTVGFRLIRLDKAMCPRLHADFIPLRLLMTYCGTGTDWLADEDADRSHLGARSEGVSDEESGLLRTGAVIRSVPPLTVALLKGRDWPGNEEKGAIHRSPALGPGERRVLLSLDILD